MADHRSVLVIKKAMEYEVMKKKELSKFIFIEEQNEKKKEVEKEVRVDE